MPEEYRLLCEQDVHSVIEMPIFNSGELRGFIGIDNPENVYSKTLTRTLGIIGNFLGNIRDNIKATQRLTYRANYDMLTGVYNRHGFNKHARNVLEKFCDVDYSIIVSDINNFKLMNEIYGDAMADQILVEEARWILARDSERSVIGRLGSDIFAILLPTQSVSEQLFEEMVAELRSKFSSKNFELYIYMGIYNIKNKQEPVRQMVDKTIMTITKIKGNMQQCIAYYDDTDYTKEMQKQQLIGEFENALKANQFCMYLQPQTDNNGKTKDMTITYQLIYQQRIFITLMYMKCLLIL